MMLWLVPGLSFANDVVTVAVASNFASAGGSLAAAFTAETGVKIRLSPGSTGKLYAQILHGAPYDIFLAADEERPLLLEQRGYSVPGSRATYALGSLLLWSRDERLRGKDCYAVLRQGHYDHVALANPETAPYGAAARQFLVAENLWDSVSRRAVYGENISQTLQFVASGNASLGLIAQAQTTTAKLPAATCSWPVPETWHAPIRQQVVLLSRATENPVARRFLEFLKTEKAAEIIRQHGYRVTD
jgi:molybdate transport system substrate-binding protein